MTIQYQSLPNQLDRLFKCLATRRRRLIIEYLTKNSTPVSIDDLVRYIQSTEGGVKEHILVSLHHNHLPRMHDAGLIIQMKGVAKIRPGERFDAAVLLLERAWSVLGTGVDKRRETNE